MRNVLLIFPSLLMLSGVSAFVIQQANRISATTRLQAIVVPLSKIEENLTAVERSITSVVRNCGPSVAFVTSVWPVMSRRRTPAKSSDSNVPQGRGLGSGSGFVVDSNGYIVTNFHVIEACYQLVQSRNQSMQVMEDLVGNVTQTCTVLGDLASASLKRMPSIPIPHIYVTINSSAKYQLCRIVNVRPDLDLAVLKIVNNTEPLPTVSFGSSGSLLVGQSLVAIGNPFGVGQTVTAGVVSALDRDISTSSTKKIRNCIQTDAAINPGNSGGPLLNLEGQVIGINTAIVSTSGSSAGVGFAVTSDQVEPAVRDMIRKDKAEQGQRPKVGYLGIDIIKGKAGNWINTVSQDSPAEKAGLRGVQEDANGLLTLGDGIVAIGGNVVKTFEELERELQTRVRDEEIPITLQNSTSGRRIVYVKLGSKP
jgi:S1-C subfamily serine protease